MHKVNHIQDKMNSLEMNKVEVKKAWVTPELEALDGRNTYGGLAPGIEDEDGEDFIES